MQSHSTVCQSTLSDAVAPIFYAACKVEFQPFTRSYSQLTFFNFYSLLLKLKNVSCEYDRVNGWNSTLQAAWYIKYVRIIWWTKRAIWLLILSFTQNIVRACSMLYPYEGYRSVTPLDAARVNWTIFHTHSVHWYYITLIKGKYYVKHDINSRPVSYTHLTLPTTPYV